MIVLYHDKLESDGEEWRVLGRVRYHTKAICNVLYISPSTTSSHITIQHKLAPRLISLAQDRVRFSFYSSLIYVSSQHDAENFLFVTWLQQIVEYDLTESTKESRGLVITFVKRIFQSALPVSMTLIYNVQKRENQLLVADSEMKFKLFDINTFEILATFLGPIYDSYVKQFVSISGTINDFWKTLRVKISIRFFLFCHYSFFYYIRMQTHWLLPRRLQSF